MSDNEKNQNDAGDGDDHFFPNGRAIKSSEDIHERICRSVMRAGTRFESMKAARSVKAVGVITRFRVLMRLLAVK